MPICPPSLHIPCDKPSNVIIALTGALQFDDSWIGSFGIGAIDHPSDWNALPVDWVIFVARNGSYWIPIGIPIGNPYQGKPNMHISTLRATSMTQYSDWRVPVQNWSMCVVQIFTNLKCRTEYAMMLSTCQLGEQTTSSDREVWFVLGHYIQLYCTSRLFITLP